MNARTRFLLLSLVPGVVGLALVYAVTAAVVWYLAREDDLRTAQRATLEVQQHLATLVNEVRDRVRELAASPEVRSAVMQPRPEDPASTGWLPGERAIGDLNRLLLLEPGGKPLATLRHGSAPAGLPTDSWRMARRLLADESPLVPVSGTVSGLVFLGPVLTAAAVAEIPAGADREPALLAGLRWITPELAGAGLTTKPERVRLLASAPGDSAEILEEGPALVSRVPLLDRKGRPLGTLALDFPREAQARALVALRWLALLFAAAGALFLVPAALLLDRLFIRRIRLLDQQVGALAAGADPAEVPEDAAADELGRLSRGALQMARSLRQVGDHYRRIVETRAEMLCRLDLRGAIIYANTSFQQAFAQRADDLTGRMLTYFVCAEDRHKVHSALENIQAGASRDTEKIDAILADGRRHVQRWSFVALRDAAGRLVEVVASGHSREADSGTIGGETETSEPPLTGEWKQSLATGVVEWSAGMFLIHGLKPGGPGLAWSQRMELVHPEDRDRVAGLLARAGADGAPWEIRCRLRLPNGQLRHILERSEVLYDPVTRAATARAGTVLDLTARVALRETLREAQMFRRAMEDSIPGGLAAFDPAGRVIHVNPSFCRLTGFEASELLQRRAPWPFLEPGEGERLRSLLAGPPVTEEREITLRHKDGTLVPVTLALAPLRDESRRALGVLGLFTDISRRRQAEENLRRTTERLSLATRAARMGVWDWDVRTGVHTWDPGMYEAFGRGTDTSASPEEVWRQSLHPQELARVEAQMQNLLEHGDSLEHEFRILLPDGSERILCSRCHVTRDASGRAVRVIGVNWDLSERRREQEELVRAKEAAEAADRAKGEFLTVMSHEIRTPLNGIIGFAALLRDAGLPGEASEMAATIETNSRILLRLLGDILDFSRLEAGPIEVIAEPVLPGAFLERIASRFGPMAEAKGLELRRELDATLPEVLLADIPRIQQVLEHLVDNAVKFTERGSVTVGLAAGETLPDGRLQVLFEVRDTGPGIPLEDQPRLFQPFSQLDSSDTRRHGGTGLGLAICRRLVELLGGRIGVRAAEGGGACFWFSLALAPFRLGGQPALPPPPPSESTPDVPEVEPPAKPVILVVEDNATNRRMMELSLRKLGHEADYAQDGLEAVAATDRRTYDVIFMDLQMPRMDGLEATGHIRRHEQEQGRPRSIIIAVTADALRTDARRCLAAGMDDYLAKPVRGSDLQEAMARHLRGRVLPSTR